MHFMKAVCHYLRFS